jgi:hypothetical protein
MFTSNKRPSAFLTIEPDVVSCKDVDAIILEYAFEDETIETKRLVTPFLLFETSSIPFQISYIVTTRCH